MARTLQNSQYHQASRKQGGRVCCATTCGQAPPGPGGVVKFTTVGLGWLKHSQQSPQSIQKMHIHKQVRTQQTGPSSCGNIRAATRSAGLMETRNRRQRAMLLRLAGTACACSWSRPWCKAPARVGTTCPSAAAAASGACIASPCWSCYCLGCLRAGCCLS